MTTFSLSDVRNGTGWPEDARFELVPANTQEPDPDDAAIRAVLRELNWKDDRERPAPGIELGWMWAAARDVVRVVRAVDSQP